MYAVQRAPSFLGYTNGYHENEYETTDRWAHTTDCIQHDSVQCWEWDAALKRTVSLLGPR